MDSFRETVSLISIFVLPLLVVGIPVYGLIRRVAVYEEFVEGAKEGFQIAVRIIPYLIAILFAVGMFRASGAMDALTNVLKPLLAMFGVPPEILPMAIVRPLTGSGSIGILTEMKQQYGGDSIFTKIAATIYASSETTFYVVAVYFGAVNVKKTRHAVPAGLIADLAGVILAVFFVKLFLG